MKRKMILLSMMMITAGFRLGAEALGLEEVRALALANSRSLARYNLAVQSAALNEKSQTYDYLPSLSLGASASLNVWGEQRLPDGTTEISGTAIGDSFGTGLSLSLSQTIWDGGKYGVLRAINALSSEIARRDALGAYFAVLDEADTAYFALLQAAAALEAADSALEKAALALSMAELRLEAGMIRQGDYLEALAEKESRETSRNQARRDLTICRAKLRALTGLEKTEIAAVDFDAHEALIQRLAALDEEEIDARYRVLLQTAAAQNPALAKAGLQSRQAEESVSLAKRDYLPTLNAGFSTGLQYSSGGNGGVSLSGGRFSLTGSIPLDFWVTGNNVAKKRLSAQEAELQYQTAGASLELEIQTALLDTVTQAGQVLSSRRALDYASRHFDYVQELFSLSQNSLSTLLDAASLVSSNRNQLIKAQYGFLINIARLRSLGAFSDEAELMGLLLGTTGLETGGH